MTTYESEIELGSEYRHRKLGIRGIAESVHFYKNACERVAIVYVHEGEVKEAHFDAVDLELVTAAPEPYVKPESGGPERSMPRRR